MCIRDRSYAGGRRRNLSLEPDFRTGLIGVAALDPGQVRVGGRALRVGGRVRQSVAQLLHAAERLGAGRVPGNDGGKVVAALATLELELAQTVVHPAALGVRTVVVKVDHRVADRGVRQQGRRDGVVIVQPDGRTTDRNGAARARDQLSLIHI